MSTITSVLSHAGKNVIYGYLGGGYIVINGTGFGGSGTLYINNSAYVIGSWTDTKISGTLVGVGGPGTLIVDPDDGTPSSIQVGYSDEPHPIGFSAGSYVTLDIPRGYPRYLESTGECYGIIKSVFYGAAEVSFLTVDSVDPVTGIKSTSWSLDYTTPVSNLTILHEGSPAVQTLQARGVWDDILTGSIIS